MRVDPLSRRHLLIGALVWLLGGRGKSVAVAPPAKLVPGAGRLPQSPRTITTYHFDAEGNCIGVEQNPPYPVKPPTRVGDSLERVTTYTYRG